MQKPPSVVVYYFRTITIITFVIGLSLAIQPNVTHLFFDDLSEATRFFVRIIGSTLIGYSFLNGLTSMQKQAQVYTLAAWTNLSTLCTASVVCIALAGKIEHNAWLLIAQHTLFALGFVYCLTKLPGPEH